MIVAFGFHAGDAEATFRLLEYIHQLGGARDHSAVLVADAGVPWERGVWLLGAANKVFKNVSFISTHEPIAGWPQGPNTLFLRAAEFAYGVKQPFLWMEPDAIPLSKDWLAKIEAAYTTGFMGHVYSCTQPGLPALLLSGIAVYPPGTARMFEKLVRGSPAVAWDVSTAPEFAKVATHTDLIQHFNPPKESPTSFPRTMKVADLKKGAVLFHSNKDGTLMAELRRLWGMQSIGDFVVVLPFCNFDSHLAEQLLQWMQTMQCPVTHEVLLSHDASTLGATVRRIESYAGMCFSKVHKTSYRVPGGTRFPQTAAWQHAARHMHGAGRSWLWMEPDCVPLRQDFLQTLQAAYDRCGMPFAGPFVHARGHMNGTAIYPAETPNYCPRTMSHTENAWDVEMRDEMMHMAHDIGSLFFHVWGVFNGKLDPLQGDSPSFNATLLHQIPASAVIMHRCKDGSLFNLLRPRLKR